jgi:hypothetical protein
MKTFDSWNQPSCLRGDVAPKCAPPRARNLKTAKPCSPDAPPAAKNAGGSPPPCVKKISATALTMRHQPRYVHCNSRKELEFVQLCRKTLKGLFGHIEQSMLSAAVRSYRQPNSKSIGPRLRRYRPNPQTRTSALRIEDRRLNRNRMRSSQETTRSHSQRTVALDQFAQQCLPQQLAMGRHHAH